MLDPRIDEAFPLTSRRLAELDDWRKNPPFPVSLKLDLATPPDSREPNALENLIPPCLHICKTLRCATVQFEFDGGLCVVLNHGTAIFWESGQEKVGKPRVWRDGAWEAVAA